MNKPNKSLRVREITAWHSAVLSPHAGPHAPVWTLPLYRVWTFSAGQQCECTFRLFLRPLCFMQTECSRGVGGGTSVCCFIKNANFWRLCRSICACVIRFTLSPVSSQSIRVVINVRGTIYLRLKPHLIKICSDIVTEYSCQVCILSMMFCPSDCRLCWLG